MTKRNPNAKTDQTQRETQAPAGHDTGIAKHSSESDDSAAIEGDTIAPSDESQNTVIHATDQDGQTDERKTTPDAEPVALDFENDLPDQKESPDPEESLGEELDEPEEEDHALIGAYRMSIIAGFTLEPPTYEAGLPLECFGDATYHMAYMAEFIRKHPEVSAEAVAIDAFRAGQNSLSWDKMGKTARLKIEVFKNSLLLLDKALAAPERKKPRFDMGAVPALNEQMADQPGALRETVLR